MAEVIIQWFPWHQALDTQGISSKVKASPSWLPPPPPHCWNVSRVILIFYCWRPRFKKTASWASSLAQAESFCPTQITDDAGIAEEEWETLVRLTLSFTHSLLMTYFLLTSALMSDSRPPPPQIFSIRENILSLHCLFVSSFCFLLKDIHQWPTAVLPALL